MSVHFIVCHHPSKAEARATVICQYPLVPGHCARKLPSRTGPLRQDLAVRFAHEGVSPGGIAVKRTVVLQEGACGHHCLSCGGGVPRLDGDSLG